MDSQKTLLVILGPTGVGKTELSLSVAEHYSSPIINADSRQIFKGIEIGTAAPVAEQLARVKHYFVHTLPLDGYYSAAEYENDVMYLLNTLFLTHDVVVLSGGSMMYIDAVTKGIDEIPTITEETRSYMKQRLEKEGLEALVCELERLDPEYAAVVDRHNTQRVVHALEICHQTGGTYTSLRTHKVKERPFRIVKIGLMREREELFDRINRRVDQMMTDGLLDEARSVYHLRNLNALNTVGYKEMFNVLDGEWELTMATERMKKNTRVYAKKQLTWYKHDSDITWINLSTTDEAHALDLIVNTVSNKEE